MGGKRWWWQWLQLQQQEGDFKVPESDWGRNGGKRGGGDNEE